MSHTAPNSTLASGTLLASYSLGWDPGGRLVSMTSTADQEVTYTYDRNDQLTSATYEKPAYADLDFSFDANGNRTGVGNTPGPDNRQASDGVSDFAYDLDGNMTRRTDKTTGAVVEYAWDLRNRLTDVTFKSSATGPITKTIHTTYDALNRRIGSSVDRDGNGSRHQDQVGRCGSNNTMRRSANGCQCGASRFGLYSVLRLNQREMETGIMTAFDRISIDPSQMDGQPCIRGMRLTVRRVLEALALYPDRLELAKEYPELEEEDIRQALAYAAALLDDKVVELHNAL